MDSVQNQVEPLNRLLRGELSAVETYEQALGKVGNKTYAQELERIRAEHLDAVESLRQEIRSFGGIADESSGVWGLWAQTVEGTATLFGEAAALKALKEGEEHGLKEYRTVLEDNELRAKFRSLLAGEMQTRQIEHIAILEKHLNTIH